MPRAHPHLRLGPPRSEGSVIAYYWSEFSIPSHLVEEAERVLAQERTIRLPPRARTLSSFLLTSVVAFRECGPAGCRGWASAGQPGRSRGPLQELPLHCGKIRPRAAGSSPGE